MHVGVVVRIVIDKRIDNGLRFLAGGGVIEINQRLAVNFLAENRKIFTNSVDIEGANRSAQKFGMNAHEAASTRRRECSSDSKSAFSRYSRTFGMPMRSM